MSNPFGKKYHLSLISDTFISSSTSKALLFSTAREITENQIEAVITFSSVSKGVNSDQHVIRVYNPSEAFISSAREENTRVVLRAGYYYSDPELRPNELPRIFEGSVVKTKVMRTGTEVILTITCSSAVKEKQNAVIERKFTKGTPIVSVAKVIAAGFGLDVIVAITSSKSLNKSYSVSMSCAQALSRFCLEHRLNWYIYNHKVFVIEIERPSEVSIVPAITIPNGLVKGTIDFSTDFSTSTADTEDVKVTFRAFLIQGLGLGDLIIVEINGTRGTYVIESLRYELNLYGDKWDMVISASSKINK